MSNVFLSVERTTANYEQTINYLIDASFNSLTQEPGSNIELVCFLPDTINYAYHTPSYPIQTITEVPVTGGTNLIFTLIPLPESGVSLYVDLYATFNLSTPNHTEVIMQVTVNQPNQSPQVYNAPTVTLSATADYIASQTTILPNATGGASGDIFVYDIILENIGDLGAIATNINLTEVLPTPLTIDTSYPITGLDISDDKFSDPSANGLTATIINANSFNFSISAYRGTKYRIRFKGRTDAGLKVGNEYITTATYSYTATSLVGPLTCSDVFQIQTPNPSGSIQLYMPNYTLPSTLINGTCSISNTGNIALQNGIFHMHNISSGTIPYIFITDLKTGTMSIPLLNQSLSIPYTISFTTLKGSTIPSILANTSISQDFNISDAPLPDGDEIISVAYTFSEDIPVGASFDTPLSINGQVATDAPKPSYAYMDTTFFWYTVSNGDQQVDANATCTIDDMSELYMTAIEVSPNNSVKPGDTITYQATIDCRYSPLTQPLFVMILDPNLSYANYITYEYYDFFGVSTNIPQPVPMIIPHYAGGSDTIFMLSYSGVDSYIFNQLATIIITLRFTVNANALGAINQQMLLGTNIGEFSVSPDFDTYNATQPDGSMRALLATNIFTNQIEVSMGLSSNFLVKGSLDTDYTQYPNIGNTLAGNSFHYQLTLTNKGNTYLDRVEIVNILPHIGDTGVILTTTPRNSQFNVYPVSFSQATLTPLVPTDPIPIFTVYYSQSYDPVRFGSNANTIIGTADDWTTVQPQDTTTIKSYKLVCTNAVFRPNQTLTLVTLAISPTNTAAHLQAWNSFAAKITYTDEDGSTATLLPVEPEMTGVKIIPPIPGTVTLSGFVWEDLAKTGIYQAGDPGINDTAVILYDHTGTFLQTVFTAPNTSGQAGYYTFSNIPHGQYYIKFVPNTLRYALTKQVLDNPNGSMPFPNTGVTPLIDMTTLTENLNIIAGLIDISQMNTILAINKSANKMLRSVIYSQMLLDMKLEDTIKLID